MLLEIGSRHRAYHADGFCRIQTHRLSANQGSSGKSICATLSHGGLDGGKIVVRLALFHGRRLTYKVSHGKPRSSVISMRTEPPWLGQLLP